MKKALILGSVCLLGALAPVTAKAQYTSIANQVASALQAPLSGSSAYKGFVEASYLKGLGNLEADFLEFTTTQGFQYNSWFYMGVGLGVQVVFTHVSENFPNYDQKPGYPWYDPTPSDWNGPTRHSRTSGVMIPLYTDFRFTPTGNDTGVYIDLRLGGDFLVGKNDLRVGDGYITNNEYFYLKPSVGTRIRTNQNNPRQALDIGVSYQLLTANYWGGWGTDHRVMNALGVSLGYEW